MKSKRFSRAAKLLLAVGALMQLTAYLAFQDMDPLLEYAVCAPDVQKIAEADAPSGAAQTRLETGLEDMLQAREAVAGRLGSAVTALSCGGIRSGMHLSGGGKDAVACLQAVDLCDLETRPRRLTRGRWMDSSELISGARVAVLDEDLAFALFGSEDAVGRELRVDGTDYRIVGTARHRRSVGEADAFSAYIPLRAAAWQGLQLDTLTMYALPAAQSGLEQSFCAAMEESWGAGSLHNLRREAMGGMLLTRLLLVALGLTLAARLWRGIRALARRFSGEISALRARLYPRQVLPGAALRVLAVAAFAAAWLAGVYALLCVAIEPVYTFTEWVPESLVELSALRTVFWSRAADAARLVRVNTPEAARCAFWGGFARCGAVCALLGLALGRGREKKMKKCGAEGNQPLPPVV